LSKLINRTFNPNVPYYIPCDFPLISETLKSRSLNISYTLLLNLDLVGLPVYFKGHELDTMDMEIWYVNKLKYKGKFFSLTNRYFDNFTIASRYLLNQLEHKHQPVICIGTTYHLPHSKDYMKKFGGHFLSVFGMDSSNVNIFDPVPHKYTGEVSLENFKKFWEGVTNEENNFFHGTYGIVEVNVNKSIPSTQLLYFNTLKTVSYEFLKGDVVKDKKGSYYFGQSCTKQLTKDLQESVSASPSTLEVVSKCLFDMRWSRYFLRDLLTEVKGKYGSPYGNLLDDLMKIIQQWEVAYNRYNLDVLRNRVSQEKVDQIVHLIQNIHDLELRLHKEIQRIHHSYHLLDREHELT
jgi:hypothetical protein